MEEVKKELRRLLKDTLVTAQQQPATQRCQTVRQRLNYIQNYCKDRNKTFIVCEIEVTCAQYGLGGSRQHTATLFRGPSEDASVAICVTQQGSLLHRNDSPWKIYCDAGDVYPTEVQTTMAAA